MLLGHTTKQPLCNFEPRQPWKYEQIWDLRPDPSCLLKISVSRQDNQVVQDDPGWKYV